MSTYRFDGTFWDAEWQGLPSPDEVKASLRRAIKDSHPEVYEIKIGRVDVTEFAADLPKTVPSGFPEASISVSWKVGEEE